MKLKQQMMEQGKASEASRSLPCLNKNIFCFEAWFNQPYCNISLYQAMMRQQYKNKMQQRLLKPFFK
ncbi:hypothetical protein A7P96_08065 [Eikenella sp. NML03-A-027]|uniref:hypothetical protein n=1 Tax=Eikenella sp. NML03-A-027 TaxID=1795828 RepID=UPI0007DEDDB7|nr:hypothetical protein [Eikenella sp. NML03-A-027]OAM30533.1 hypothetical protein A7P96_08065 [Eikenella sp. NML03-A-027]